MSSSASTAKRQKLLDALYNKAVDKSTTWQKIDGIDGYSLPLDKYSVFLWKSDSGVEDLPDFKIKILSGSGVVVDEFSDRDVSNDVVPGSGLALTYFDLLQEIFDSVADRADPRLNQLDELIGILSASKNKR